MSMLRVLALAGLVSLVAPALALAQPLGTFRWQIQPYCNVLSISVVQQGGIYLLNGNDDQCAAPQQASVVGLAFPNPDGTIGFGLTIVTAPGGTPVHIDATITIATLGGTWRDSAGNNGTFVFTPGAGIGGGPRPVPSGGIAPGSITMVQLGPDSVGSTQVAANAIGSSEVANGTLTRDDLADPTTANFSGANHSNALGPAAVFRTVFINAPAAGRLIVSASGYFDFNSAGLEDARCSINIGLDAPAVDGDALIIATDSGNTAMIGFVPFAATRGFTVAAGTHLLRLICQLNSGVVDINDTQLTAIFVAS